MVLLTQGSECKRPITLMSKDINYPLFTANLSCHWGLGAWRLAEHGLQGRTATLSFMRNHKCFDWEIILCATESGGLIPLRPGCCPTACSCVCMRSCVCIVTAYTLFVWWLHADETAFMDEFLVFMIHLRMFCGAGKMVQPVKCPLPKHRNLSSDHEKPSTDLAWWFKPVPGEWREAQRQENPWSSFISLPSPTDEISKGPCLKI